METNNILMAEFLGWESTTKEVCNDLFDDIQPKRKLIFESPKGNYTDSGLKFHSDWNWLMMVVEKIESLGSTVVFEQDNLVIITTMTSPSPYKVKQQSVTKESKIEATYIACIEFIKWYNEHN